MYKELIHNNKRAIYEAYEKKLVYLKSFPRIIQVEHTNKCNLECIACPHFYQKNINTSDIDNKIIYNIEKILPYIEQIQLNGGGEPFITRNIDKILSIYAKYNMNITTTTNLTVLDENVINIISKYFSAINVSCDGATKKTFESIRKNSNFEKFVENVKKIRRCSEKLKITFGVTAMRQNIAELPEILTLAHIVGANKMVIGRMIPRPDQLPHTIYDDLINYPKVANHYFELTKKIAANYRMPLVLPHNFPVGNLSFKDELVLMLQYPLYPSEREQGALIAAHKKSLCNQNPGPKNSAREIIIEPPSKKIEICGICNWLMEISFIDHSGNVYACCQRPYNIIGNLNETSSFYEIWNSKTLMKLRQAYFDGFIPYFCYGCQFISQRSLDRLHIKSTINMSEFRTIF